MEREIYAQAEAWRSALEAVDRAAPSLATLLASARGREVRFVGSGSSYYLGLAAGPVWGRCGWMTRALPSAEQLLHPDAYPSPESPLAIGVSRSGTTTEVLRALRRLRDGGSPTLGITTRTGTPMDEVCDVVVHVEGAQESSTVQTRSFSAQFIAVQAIAWAESALGAEREALGRLPGLADAWIRASDAHVTSLASRFTRVYVLGTGSRWGLALEGALKLKETSRTESEAFQTLEFRHGPKSMVDEDTYCIDVLTQIASSALFRFGVGMSVVVFLLFRTFVPSIAVVVSAFSDVVIPIAVMNLLGIQLSLGTVAALLMLIGYSVDSDILLNNHVIRRGGGFYESAYSAMRTGVTMTLTSLSAVIVMTFVATFFGVGLLASIGTVLAIGLTADLMNTYLLNMSLLRWYKYEGVAR
jgi:fructoselysine-6-P-deglycase FrlB-like protein